MKSIVCWDVKLGCLLAASASFNLFFGDLFQLLFKKSEESESIKKFQSDPEFRRVVFHERTHDKNGTGSIIRGKGKGIRPFDEHTKLGKISNQC